MSFVRCEECGGVCRGGDKCPSSERARLVAECDRATEERMRAKEARDRAYEVFERARIAYERARCASMSAYDPLAHARAALAAYDAERAK